MRLTTRFALAFAVIAASVIGLHAQSTPNIGLSVPVQNSTRWDIPMNANSNRLDAYLSGNAPLPALAVTGTFTAGATTVGSVTVTGNATIDGNLYFPNYTTSTIGNAANPPVVYTANRGWAQAVISTATSYTLTSNDCGNLLLFDISANAAITLPNPATLPELCDIHIAAPTGHPAVLTSTIANAINSAAAYGQTSYTVPQGTDVDLLGNTSNYFVSGISASSSGVNATQIQSNAVASGTPATGQGYFWNGSALAVGYADVALNPTFFPAPSAGNGYVPYTTAAGHIQGDSQLTDDGSGDLTSNGTISASGFYFNGGYQPGTINNVSGFGAMAVTTYGGGVSMSNKNLIGGDGTGNVQSTALQGLSGSAAITGTALAAGACTTAVTATVTGATVGRIVVATPNDGTILAGSFSIRGSVSATNTVSLQVCAGIAGTPPTKTYNFVVF